MKRMVTMCAFVGSIAGGMSVSAITGDQPERARRGRLCLHRQAERLERDGHRDHRRVVLVDTGNNTTDTRELLKHVQSVTKQPVRYVVITQNHNDHSGGAAPSRPRQRPSSMSGWRSSGPA